MNEDYESNSLLSDKDFERVIEYHNRTKHRTDGYAKSSGAMDWSNEPAPRRIFDGTPKARFPLNTPDLKNNYIDIYSGAVQVKPFSFSNVGKFMELSMGLSAWKNYGKTTWALRVNPSSGNLHPTESYLVLPDLGEVGSGVYHYNAYEHELEKRADLESSLFGKRSERGFLLNDSFYIGLTSIYWREAWKYGERAFRYCNHDVGHAIACLTFSANLMGWDVKALLLSDGDIDTVLGLDKTKWHELEEDHGDVILQVTPKGSEVNDVLSCNIDKFKELDFSGTPNKLSETPVRWQVIEDVSLSTKVKEIKDSKTSFVSGEFVKTDYGKIGAVEIIRKRRSAQHFDGETFISKVEFLSILDKTLPRSGVAPFDCNLPTSNADLLVFVHRVNGLESGLYFYHRGGNGIDRVKDAYNKDLKWEEIEGTGKRLFLLDIADFREAAKVVSCNQAIAGDSCFSLGMVVKFKDILEEDPSMYKKLFWETGMIGQVLYLEAEALGIRGTGIGCFFDDLIHKKIIGLTDGDNSYQTIYHFTIGGHLEDERLETLEPYFHLKGDGHSR